MYITFPVMTNPDRTATRKTKSIASLSLLRSSQLVHLGDALLELVVLAFLIGVSLVLYRKQPSVTQVCAMSNCNIQQQSSSTWAIPRTSTADSTPRSGSGSAVSADGRSCLCTGWGGGRRTFPRGWRLAEKRSALIRISKITSGYNARMPCLCHPARVVSRSRSQQAEN